MVPAELLDQLPARENLLVTVGPAEARQVVEDGVGKISHVTILENTDRGVALRELFAVRRKHHRHVGEGWYPSTERLVEKDLRRGVDHVIVAAGDQRDAHRQVIDHAAEVVEGHSIGAQQDEVLLSGVEDVDLALDLVHPAGGSLMRGPEPNHVGGVRILGRVGAVSPRALETEAVLGAALLMCFPRGGDLPLRRVAAIGVARLDQLLGVLRVHAEALALYVGTVVTSDSRAFVPVQAEPPHGFQHDLNALLGAALAVGVLDAEDERAVVLARPQPTVQSCPHPADVQVTRGRGREPNANFRHGRRATCPP